jgi:serine protease AprX
MKRLLIIFLLVVSQVAMANLSDGNIYWVQFTTKSGTPYSLQESEKFLSVRSLDRRWHHHIPLDSTDLPVNPSFTDSLRSLGFYVKHTSRWLNGAIVIYQDTIPIDHLNLPSFVSYIQLRKDISLKSASNKFDEIDSLTQKYYGNSYRQITMINGHLLHKFSKGESVHVAVIDAGFKNADQLEVFDSLFARNGILGTYDFVSPGGNVYNEHTHGTYVLSIMAGNHPGMLVGTAPNASYWLLRSEDASTESPVEEDYWVVAAEFADSVGCEVINSSLGYTTFDNTKFNHNYGEFSGDSLRISKAANLAVKKGIVVVCAAGNEGGNSWKYISVPSEARDVIAVAAVDPGENIAYFSSRGFGDSALVPKPDVAAMGSNDAFASTDGGYSYGSGTSFASPVLAGMAACLVSLYPDSSAFAIENMIRKVGNLYPVHSDSTGYGIPDFSEYLPDIPVDTTDAPLVQINNKIVAYPNPFVDKLTIFSSEKLERIELFSFDGQLVLSITKGMANSCCILSDKLGLLSKGVYTLRIRTVQSIKTIKLIRK